MNNDLKEIYNRFAEKYKQNRGLFDMSNIIADFAGRLSRVPGHLLDLGCGAGEPFLRTLLNRGGR
jgi:ubiquinone/menaquinone biosynthesis C-methylase UbiE